MLKSQLSQAPALLEMLPDQAFPTNRYLARVGVCMIGV